MFQSSHSPGTFTIKAAVLGFRLWKDSPQTNLNFVIPICFGRSTAMSLVALEHQPWRFLEERPGHWISFHPQRGVQPKVKAKDWHKPSSQDCYVPRSTGTKKVWPSLCSHLIPCEYRQASGQRGLWLFRHICSQDVGSPTLRSCCPFSAECFLWSLCLSVSLVQWCLSWVSVYFTLPASLHLSDDFWVCVCVHVCMCTCIRLSLPPSVCPSFSPSICLPLFQSACPSCLSLSALSLSPSSTVCLCMSIYDYHDCPVNQGCILTFMGPALLPSWALSCMKKKLQHILWLHWHRGKYNPGCSHNCTLIIIIFSFSPD